MYKRIEMYSLTIVLVFLLVIGAAIKWMRQYYLLQWDLHLVTSGLMADLAGFGAVFFTVLVLEGALALLRKKSPKGPGALVKGMCSSPPLVFSLMLGVMLSFEVRPLYLGLGSLLAAVISRLGDRDRRWIVVPPVLWGYLAVLALSLNPVPEYLPGFLQLPKGEAAGYPLALALTGTAGGPLSFQLLLPLGVVAVFLIRRRFWVGLWPLMYLGIYGAGIGGFWLLAAPSWDLLQPLILNGGVLLTAIFLLPLSYRSLPKGVSFSLYNLLLALATVMLSIQGFVIAGPYLALAAVQLLVLGTSFFNLGNPEKEQETGQAAESDLSS